MIRVLLVDDHKLVRYGLQQLLAAAEDIEVVGTAADGVEALERLAELRPDVVLMDLLMPRLDGVEATRRASAVSPQSQVVVLTSFSDRDRILDAIDAGAVGYLLKDVDPSELLDGIRAAARGESPLHPKAARELLLARSGVPGDAPTSSARELTPREVEVLRLVRRGLANKQIGRRLGISERTVKAHLTSIFQRVGVTDRTSAALWAERQDL